MITTIENGIRKIPSHFHLLDEGGLKFDYTHLFLDELGFSCLDGFEPEFEEESWFLQGLLHGIPVSASYNVYEDLCFKIKDRRVTHKGDLIKTLNAFISTYRGVWDDHN
jgi:hypothetical protein